MYPQVQSIRLYEQVVEHIKQRIITGDLPPGTQLPTERELSEQFGVSRTVIREATKALMQSGLIDVQPGRGTFVVDTTHSALKDSLGLIMSYSKTANWNELVEIREILEPAIAALAAERATEEDIKALSEAVARMDASLDNQEVYIEADNDFHLALAEAARNTLLSLLLDPVVDLLVKQRGLTFKIAGGPQSGQEHHKEILAAIKAHAPIAAREAMRSHLQQVREDVKIGLSLNDHSDH